MVEVIEEKVVVTSPEPAEPTVTTKKTAEYSSHHQVIYLIFGILEGLILIRFAFRLLSANSGTPIVAMIYSLTDVLMAPFRFIFSTDVVEGAVFDWTALVAVLFYAALAWVLGEVIDILFTKDLAK